MPACEGQKQRAGCRPHPTARIQRTPLPPPLLCRLPKGIPLRMVGVGMSLPESEEGINRYLGKLKEAALHLRTLHMQVGGRAGGAGGCRRYSQTC